MHVMGRHLPIKTILAALFIFVCGGITGHAVTMYLLHAHMGRMFERPEEFTERMAGRIADDFALDDAARRAVTEILMAGHKDFRALHEDGRNRIDAIRNTLRDRIAALLPDGPARVRFVERFEEYMPRPPKPGPLMPGPFGGPRGDGPRPPFPGGPDDARPDDGRRLPPPR